MGWKKLQKIQHAITLPAVIIGVILSTRCTSPRSDRCS